jgi:hypothetical protein
MIGRFQTLTVLEDWAKWWSGTAITNLKIRHAPENWTVVQEKVKVEELGV